MAAALAALDVARPAQVLVGMGVRGILWFIVGLPFSVHLFRRRLLASIVCQKCARRFLARAHARAQRRIKGTPEVLLGCPVPSSGGSPVCTGEPSVEAEAQSSLKPRCLFEEPADTKGRSPTLSLVVLLLAFVLSAPFFGHLPEHILTNRGNASASFQRVAASFALPSAPALLTWRATPPSPLSSLWSPSPPSASPQKPPREERVPRIRETPAKAPAKASAKAPAEDDLAGLPGRAPATKAPTKAPAVQVESASGAKLGPAAREAPRKQAGAPRALRWLGRVLGEGFVESVHVR